MLMNPSGGGGAGMRDLPLTVYEEAIHVVNDQTSSEFVPTKYVVQADEAERITVTYCAKVVNQEESGSAVIAHYTTMSKSVKSLRDRIQVLHDFLVDVKRGKIDVNRNGDQQILREIKGLCLRLPVMDQDKFRSDLLAVSRRWRLLLLLRLVHPRASGCAFIWLLTISGCSCRCSVCLSCQEYSDALLVTYLSSMTKGAQLMADVQEKFQLVHRDESIGHYTSERRARGLMGDDEGGLGDRRRGRGEGGFMSGILGSFGMG